MSQNHLSADVLVGKPVIPGDAFSASLSLPEANSPISVGPGLKLISCSPEECTTDESNEQCTCTYEVQHAGVLSKSSNESDVFFVNSAASFQYEPNVGDYVVGLVVGRIVDYYRVAIRSRELAFLGQLSFEGATKRNRPEVHIGDVIFARVVSVAPGIGGRQAELVCVSPETDKAEGMGVLRDPSITGNSAQGGGCAGIVFTLQSQQAIQRLVSSKNKSNRALGKRLPFEAAYGYNGVVWVRARSVRETILVANLLQAINEDNSRHARKDWPDSLIDAALSRISGAQ